MIGVEYAWETADGWRYSGILWATQMDYQYSGGPSTGEWCNLALPGILP